MKTKPENPPAFPTHNGLDADNKPHGGMTLRDHFAASADVSGYEFGSIILMAKFAGVDAPEDGELEAHFHLSAKAFAKLRYMMADAMLATRQPQPEEK